MPTIPKRDTWWVVKLQAASPSLALTTSLARCIQPPIHEPTSLWALPLNKPVFSTAGIGSEFVFFVYLVVVGYLHLETLDKCSCCVAPRSHTHTPSAHTLSLVISIQIQARPAPRPRSPFRLPAVTVAQPELNSAPLPISAKLEPTSSKNYGCACTWVPEPVRLDRQHYPFISPSDFHSPVDPWTPGPQPRQTKDQGHGPEDGTRDSGAPAKTP